MDESAGSLTQQLTTFSTEKQFIMAQVKTVVNNVKLTVSLKYPKFQTAPWQKSLTLSMSDCVANA